MDFDLSGRSEAWVEKLQAFFDAEVLPRHRAWLASRRRQRRGDALHGRPAAKGARGGPVESRSS